MRGDKKRCMNYAGQCLEHPQVKVTDIDEVCKADHLILRRYKVYDHHFIVSDVDYDKEILKLTEFDGPFPEGGGKARVVSNEKQFSTLEGTLYKVVYGKNEARKRGDVLRRAAEIQKEFEQMGNNVTSDKRYNLFLNNCEHFAYYCKLDDKKSVQVRNFARTAGGVSANAIKDLVRIYLLDKNAKEIPTKLKIGGGVVAGLIETALSADDIYRYYQMMEKGTIDEDEFAELVLKRVSVAIFSVLGTELGSMAGLTFGGPVGLFIGGILGNIAGKFAGRAMGESVEFGKDVVLMFLERYGNPSHPHAE